MRTYIHYVEGGPKDGDVVASELHPTDMSAIATFTGSFGKTGFVHKYKRELWFQFADEDQETFSVTYTYLGTFDI